MASSAVRLQELLDGGVGRHRGRVRLLGGAAGLEAGGQGERRADGARSPWRLEVLAGRMVEISGGGAPAVLSAAMGLVLEAQRAGEPVAWIAAGVSTFYPPDAAACGVDLRALAVVLAAEDGVGACRGRGPRRRTLGGGAPALRAAQTLLRSGAFGLVVVDLDGAPMMTLAAQTRLAGLAQTHHTALVFLTRKPESVPSLGSMVSLRVEARRKDLAAGDRLVVEDRIRPGTQPSCSAAGPFQVETSRPCQAERGVRGQGRREDLAAGDRLVVEDRIRPRTQPSCSAAGPFQVAIHALKDKRFGPGWDWTEPRHVPPGLR
jgi:recombination protein RecA